MITGDLAVVVVEENLTQRGYDGTQRSQVIATNVFERVGTRMVHGDASRVAGDCAARRRTATAVAHEEKFRQC